MQKFLCGLLTAGLFLAWASLAHADDTAKAIIEKAIKAHGGADNLAKLKVRREKVKGTFEVDGIGHTSTSEILYQLPGRRKITSEGESEGRRHTTISVITPDKGWLSNDGKTRESTADQLRIEKEWPHRDYLRTLAPLLKDRGFTLAPLGEVKVGDRPALGVKVSTKDRQDVDLYFDKENGLLVKHEAKEKRPMQDMDVASVYSHYKEIDGVTWPMKEVRYRDGKRLGEMEITELRFLDKIDDSEFAKP